MKEQWSRVLRFRERYAAALANAPRDLMSLVEIPPARRQEIGRWFDDCRDYGNACCIYLHHLVDWMAKDPNVSLDGLELREFVRASSALQVVGDLCNGSKHAVLDRRPWSSVPVSVAPSLRLSTEQSAETVKATHTVSVGSSKVPLLDVIDEALELWRELLAKRYPAPEPSRAN